MSFCYWAGHSVDVDIEAGTDFGDSPSEPLLGWDSRTNRWNTSAIRDQLGNTGQTANYTLKLKNNFTSTDFRNSPPYSLEWEFGNYSQNRTDLYDPGQPAPDLALCSFCSLSSNPRRFQYRSHPVQAAVFRDVLAFTTQLSQAMQAYITTQFQMRYYDLLIQFDKLDTATVVASVPVGIPVRYTALIIMGAILCFHLIFVFIILYLFLIGTKVTRLGDTWQAISQLQSEEIQETFREGAVSDRSMLHAFGTQGGGNPSFSRRG